MDDYWFKQTIDKPLYPDLIWSKPENKIHAGKLLIIGGSTNGFAHTVDCYQEAQRAGAGAVKVVIPDSTTKLIGNWSDDIIFATSTKSGGFGQAALAEFISSSEWADTVLISGELGNNSETTILFEKYFSDYKGALVIASDAFDFCESFHPALLKNSKVTFILDINQLQKLARVSQTTKPITSSIGVVNLVEIIHEMTEKNDSNIVVRYGEFVIVGSQGYVSTTAAKPISKEQMKLAAVCAVWYMQNQTKVFEALVCSCITYQSTEEV